MADDRHCQGSERWAKTTTGIVFCDVDNLYGLIIRAVTALLGPETDLMTKKLPVTTTTKGVRDGAQSLSESCSTMLITYMGRELGQ